MNKVILCFVIIVSMGLCCKDEPTKPPDEQPAIMLQQKDVSCTDVSLQLTLKNLDKKLVDIQRDGKTIKTLIFTNTDTIVFDEGLIPGKSYTYQAIRQQMQSSLDVSFPLPIRTLDTTSHNFTYQLFTFGDGVYADILKDVVAIDDFNLFAVGQIHAKDSINEADMQIYGLLRWKGNQWKSEKVYYHDYGMSTQYPGPLNTIIEFDTNDVFVCSLANLLHWNGNEWGEKAFFATSIPFTGQVIKMWGMDKNNIYCVGNNGTIFAYSDNTWSTMASGTSLNLLGISGFNSHQIYACGTIYGSGLSAVLSFDGTNWKTMMDGRYESTGFVPDQLFKTQLYGLVEDVWADRKSTMWVVGDYIYKYKWGRWSYASGIPQNNYQETVTTRGYLHTVTGTNANNVVVAGEYSTILHYNGSTWKTIGPAYDLLSDLDWFGASMKGNTLVVVGCLGRKAAVMVLKQQ